MRVPSGRCHSGSEALFSGHSRGVDVGVAECVQGQMPMMWVSEWLMVWGIGLAAISG